MKRRNIQKNERGITSILELLISATIIFVVFAFFFTSFQNYFTTYERPDINFQAKLLHVTELILNSPGETIYKTTTWEQDPVNISKFGLAASPLIAYGGLFVDLTGAIDDYSQYTLADGDLTGLSRSCFAAGTLISMSDGTSKHIEDVLVGDMVNAFDSQTNTIVSAQVLQVFHHPAEEMGEYYLRINDWLNVTPNHLVFINNTWKTFDELRVGDVINGVPVSSITKVYEQVPTYNLEVAQHHNYLVSLSNHSVLVHNQGPDLSDYTNIDWRPWSAVRKPGYPDDFLFVPYGGRYFNRYTKHHDDWYIYEVKDTKNYPNNVVDFEKCNALSDLDYSLVHSLLGLDSNDYVLYDINITITSPTEVISWFGPSYDQSYTAVSLIRNVVIYHKPVFASNNVHDLTPPYYEHGQITIQLFLGGSFYPPSGGPSPPTPPPPAGGEDIENGGNGDPGNGDDSGRGRSNNGESATTP